MKSFTRLFAKSSGTRSSRRCAKPSPASPFETLEPRQFMSASTITQVNWGTAAAQRTATYEIGSDRQVYESCGDGFVQRLGGQATQISAGLDAAGKPEVYAVGVARHAYENSGSGWVDLGAPGGLAVTQLSGDVGGVVYALAANKQVYSHDNSGWHALAGQASQISAGVDAAGKPEVYAIGTPSPAVFVNDGKGWVALGGQAKQISGSTRGTVYAVGEDNAVWVDTGTGYNTWRSLGGVVSQITASVDAAGNPDVFAIGTPSNHSFVNDGKGWVDYGCSASEIAAPAFGVAMAGNTFAIRGFDTLQHCVHTASGVKLLPLNEPAPLNAATSSYKDYSGDPLFAPGGPSADDVHQRGIGDCYYMAALSAIAGQDPGLIRRDIAQRADGTYDVYFHSGTAIVDEHVDGYLPDGGETATLGTGNCTWVPIMEKAFAYFCSSTEKLAAPTYAAIGGGNGNEALCWDGGTNVADQRYSSGPQMYINVATDLARHQAVVIATNEADGPLVKDHLYTVVAARHTTAGGDQYLVRNPWGYNPGFVANQNGFRSTDDGYQWVGCAAILPQVTELVTAVV